MATYNLYANQSAIGDWANPDTNFSTGTMLEINTNKRAYIKFDGSPALYKRITSLKECFFVVSRDTNFSVSNRRLTGILGDWDESSVTSNNFPGAGYFEWGKYPPPASGWWISEEPPEAFHFIQQMVATGLRVVCFDPSYMTIYSSRHANKPYLLVTAEPVTLSIANMFPNAFMDRKIATTFSWEPTNPYESTTIGKIVQTSAKLRYRQSGDTNYTEISITGAIKNYTFAEYTFLLGNYEWQVEVSSNDGGVVTSVWKAFTTIDKTPLKAQIIEPISKYINGAIDNVFSWDHIVDTGSPQTRADLQYAVGANDWQLLLTVMSAQESVTVTANSLPPGKLAWRVRTYNTEGYAGDWSDSAAFICERAPDAPTITGVTQCNRPTITWQVIGQVAYQLVFDSYDTGEVAGTVKSYKLKDYASNGTHTVKLRALGSTGLWSQWSELTLTLNATAPSVPTLTAEAVTSGAKLTFTGGVKSYLLRDGVPIANVSGLTEYTDYMALGAAIYTLRAVDANDNYADSAPAGAVVTVPCAVIAAVDAPAQLVLLRLTREKPREISGNFDKTVTYRYYAGRKKPVAQFAGQDAEKYSLRVSFLKATEKADLVQLVNREKTMLYRDAWGNRHFVTISSLGLSQDSVASSIDVSMTVTDYTERVEYEG